MDIHSIAKAKCQLRVIAAGEVRSHRGVLKPGKTKSNTVFGFGTRGIARAGSRGWLAVGITAVCFEAEVVAFAGGFVGCWGWCFVAVWRGLISCVTDF